MYYIITVIKNNYKITKKNPYFRTIKPTTPTFLITSNFWPTWIWHHLNESSSKMLSKIDHLSGLKCALTLAWLLICRGFRANYVLIRIMLRYQERIIKKTWIKSYLNRICVSHNGNFKLELGRKIFFPTRVPRHPRIC